MITEETKLKFSKLINGMDIPEERKAPTEVNFLWFLRNAWIKNQHHKNFLRVQELVKKSV